jgi:hypothetical protein
VGRDFVVELVLADLEDDEARDEHDEPVDQQRPDERRHRLATRFEIDRES